MACSICNQESPTCKPWGTGRSIICVECASADPERMAIAKLYMAEDIDNIAKQLAVRFGVDLADNKPQLDKLAAIQIAMPNIEITGAISVSRKAGVVMGMGSMAFDPTPLPRDQTCDCARCRGARAPLN